VSDERVDVAIVDAGAAGLMAAIWAGRTDPSRSIVALDGATRLGAKILIAGGGRCARALHRRASS
jgi:predicted flavoprotein YhiN